MDGTASTNAESVKIEIECPVCGETIEDNEKDKHCQPVTDLTTCPNGDECKNKNGTLRKGCDGYLCGSLGMGMFLGNNILVDGHNLTREGPNIHPWLHKVKEGLKTKFAAKYGNLIEEMKLSYVSRKTKQHPLYVGRGSIQAHHLICSESMNNEKGKNLCKTIGYNINCKLNGVYLPSDIKLACHTHIQRHRGGHSLGYGNNVSYVETVKAKLRGILSDEIEKAEGECKDVDKNNILTELNNLSSEILTNIKGYIWTISWDGFNYTNGGIGCAGAKNMEDKRSKMKEILNEELLGGKGIVLKDGKYQFNDIKKIQEDTDLNEKIKNGMSCPKGRDHNKEGYPNKLRIYRQTELNIGY